VRVFIIAYEEGPELDALVKAVGKTFEIEGDITTLVTALAGAFGVRLVAGFAPPVVEEAVRGLLLLQPLRRTSPGREGPERAHAATERRRAG
jgi:hypothetical protein